MKIDVFHKKILDVTGFATTMLLCGFPEIKKMFWNGKVCIWNRELVDV